MTRAVEVRGIHHRAIHSFRFIKWKNFGFGQNTGETLPNFRQKSKGNLKRIWDEKGKKVICTRHLPGVGHAQDLARIPKRKLGRVLSRLVSHRLLAVDSLKPLSLLLCNRKRKVGGGRRTREEDERHRNLDKSRSDLPEVRPDTTSKSRRISTSPATMPFARLYASVDADIEALRQKAEIASKEKNKASAVALNAEIRRTKARLLEEVPKLQRLAVKKVKGLSTQDFAARNDLVHALPDRIQDIPDGTPFAPNKLEAAGQLQLLVLKSNLIRRGGWIMNSSNNLRSRVNSGKSLKCGKLSRQDQGLDMISDGLDTLKNMAQDMNEEFDRQVPLMDEIDSKVDKASADLKNTNVRLKDTVNQCTEELRWHKERFDQFQELLAFPSVCSYYHECFPTPHLPIENH
ncbi:syntaxin of plants 71 [Prunus dulcis]|uniref:Syntaxin of plants 71 n=1 Tax=Prunus dulcis TaxID=3755 RepID=A0A4Y1RP11_PRUDU|nr:syntaxin of plants 71 [Prunus dulcis]